MLLVCDCHNREEVVVVWRKIIFFDEQGGWPFKKVRKGTQVFEPLLSCLFIKVHKRVLSQIINYQK